MSDSTNDFIDPDGALAEIREEAQHGLPKRAIALALADIAASLRALAFVEMNR
jgi:hypothetical protein